MSVIALGTDWEGFYSCRWCGALCSTSRWSEPHEDESCFGNLQDMIARGDLIRSPKSRVGDLAFGEELGSGVQSNGTEEGAFSA